MDRKSKNNPDRFCYICSNVVLPNHQSKTIDFVNKAYRDYFGVKLVDQDKSFAPHVYYKTCGENLRVWKNGKRKSILFAIPVVWRERKDHVTDLPVSESDGNMEYSSDFEHSDMTVVARDDACKPEEDDQP